jgi:hypothetical protein
VFDGAAVLCAFDLIELDGEDLSRTTRAMAKSFSSTPANSGVRASYQNVLIEHNAETRPAHQLGQFSPHWVKVKKSESACCETRGGGGLGTLSDARAAIAIKRSRPNQPGVHPTWAGLLRRRRWRLNTLDKGEIPQPTL